MKINKAWWAVRQDLFNVLYVPSKRVIFCGYWSTYVYLWLEKLNRYCYPNWCTVLIGILRTKRFKTLTIYGSLLILLLLNWSHFPWKILLVYRNVRNRNWKKLGSKESFLAQIWLVSGDFWWKAAGGTQLTNSQLETY